MNDKQLIAQLKTRDRTALKNVYREYRIEFLKFASRYTTDKVTLEDIFQDAIIAVNENALAGKLDHLNSTVKTYLFSTGKFMVFKKFRDTVETNTDESYFVSDYHRRLMDQAAW